MEAFEAILGMSVKGVHKHAHEHTAENREKTPDATAPLIYTSHSHQPVMSPQQIKALYAKWQKMKSREGRFIHDSREPDDDMA